MPTPSPRDCERERTERRTDIVLALGLFIVALTVYLRTLCPTVYWGDCGELATAAYTLGITHPTGYPVYCLLGKLWTMLLPVGSVIWRLNVLSAVFGALGVVALYGFARALPLPRPLALGCVGMFACSFTFWQQCLFAETYSLTACYTCTLLFLAARWRTRGRHPKDLCLLAAMYGLAMTNHQINTLFLPGFIGFVLWTEPTLRRLRDAQVRRQWLAALVCGAAPLLFYFYLPLRAAAHPAISWGDPRTPFAFFYYVTGRAYANTMFHSPLSLVVTHLAEWTGGLSREISRPLIPFAVLGLVSLWRSPPQRPMALLLTWVVAADVFYTINYDIYNAYIYFIPSYLALLTLAGWGLWWLWGRVGPLIRSENRSWATALGAGVVLALAPLQAVGNWHYHDLSHDWVCYDYGRNLLASTPSRAILVNNESDTAWAALTYLQDVEHRRPDVTVIQRGLLRVMYDTHYRRWANEWAYTDLRRRHPDVTALGPSRLTPQEALDELPLKTIIAQALAQGRPVAFLHPESAPTIPDERGRREPMAEYLNQNYATAQVGVLLRLYPRGQRPSDIRLLAETRRVWGQYSLRGVYDGLYLKDDFLTPIAFDYAEGGLARARLAYTQGDYGEAADTYSSVLRLFRSDEASAGLARCAEAQKRSHAPTETTNNAPRDTERHAVTQAAQNSAAEPKTGIIADEPTGARRHNLHEENS